MGAGRVLYVQTLGICQCVDCTRVRAWCLSQLGYRMGMAAVLAFWILWDCCLEPGEDDPRWQVSVLLHPAFPVREGGGRVPARRGSEYLVWDLRRC